MHDERGCRDREYDQKEQSRWVEQKEGTYFTSCLLTLLSVEVAEPEGMLAKVTPDAGMSFPGESMAVSTVLTGAMNGPSSIRAAESSMISGAGPTSRPLSTGSSEVFMSSFQSLYEYGVEMMPKFVRTITMGWVALTALAAGAGQKWELCGSERESLRW